MPCVANPCTSLGVAAQLAHAGTQQLELALGNSSTVKGVVAAHDEYLEQVARACLLSSSTALTGGRVLLAELRTLVIHAVAVTATVRRFVSVALGTALATAKLYPQPNANLTLSHDLADPTPISKPILGRADVARLFESISTQHAAFCGKVRFLLAVAATSGGGSHNAVQFSLARLFVQLDFSGFKIFRPTKASHVRSG